MSCLAGFLSDVRERPIHVLSSYHHERGEFCAYYYHEPVTVSQKQNLRLTYKLIGSIRQDYRIMICGFC